MTSPADDQTTAGAPGPMDDARCLLVLGLLRDGRPVDQGLARAAASHAEAHPEVAAQAAELALISDAVAALPGFRTSDGFTERVLAERRSGAGAPRQRVVPLALRLSAAAALFLAVVLMDGVRRPVDSLADPSVERQSFEADAFRETPYAEPDLAVGLTALLPGPLDGDEASPAEAPEGDSR